MAIVKVIGAVGGAAVEAPEADAAEAEGPPIRSSSNLLPLT